MTAYTLRAEPYRRGARMTYTDNGGGAVDPVLDEDFSTYTSTADLLADPRVIWATGESANTARIALDASVGYGNSAQSMRYDWPNNGASCLDYSIRPGRLETGGLTHLWVEAVIRTSANFTVDGGTGGCAKEYKLLFLGDSSGIERFGIDWQAGQWVMGYPGNLSGFTPSDVVPSTLWDGDPHVLHVEVRVSPSGGTGIMRVACDDVMLMNETGFDNLSSHEQIDWVTPGANMNQGPNIDNMKLWWHRLAVYDESPGWVGF